MRKKFNILCSILALAMIFGWIVDYVSHREANSISFNQGRESAREYHTDENGIMSSSRKGNDWYYVDIVAKDYHNPTDSIYNEATGRYEQMVLEEVIIKSEPMSEKEQKLYDTAAILISLVYLLSIGYFWFMLIFCIINVNKEKMFAESLESRFTRMGICLIIAYISEWTMEILGYFWSMNHISLENYDIVIDGPSCYFLCFGIGMIIVSELFKMARSYREENEMTI